MAKRGRPPIPSDRARSQRVVTFLTPREFDQLNELAKEQQSNLSSTIHRVIGEYLARHNNT